MVLPLILGAVALGSAALGVKNGAEGVGKMMDADKQIKQVKEEADKYIADTEKANENAQRALDKLGRYELEVIQSFSDFQKVFEKIKNRPQFNGTKISDELPTFNIGDIENASIGAEALLSSLGGAGLGVAGAIAAQGATTAAVMALGTASTGTAISSLGGVAATNATLAALGGGSIAAGGGGMALGATVLGASTFGVGLLVGGTIMNFAGDKLKGKVEEAQKELKNIKRQSLTAINLLNDVSKVSSEYYDVIRKVNHKYIYLLTSIENIVESGKTNYLLFTDNEKKTLENLVLIVTLLHGLCKVQLLNDVENEHQLKTVNYKAIKEYTVQSEIILKEIAAA